MSHKQASEDHTPTEEQQLIDRVDAMMDIKRTDASKASSLSPVADSGATLSPAAVTPAAGEPIDIFKGLNTAPPVEVVEATPSDEPEETEETAPEPDTSDAPEEKNEPASAPELPSNPDDSNNPAEDETIATEEVANESPEEVQEPVVEKATKAIKKSPPQPKMSHDDYLIVDTISPDIKPVAKNAVKSPLKISVFDDAETDKAVDEIVIAEGDALLLAEDIAATVSNPVKKPKKGLGKLFE